MNAGNPMKVTGIFTTDRTDLESGYARATKIHLRYLNIDVPRTHSGKFSGAQSSRSSSSITHAGQDTTTPPHSLHSIVLPRIHPQKNPHAATAAPKQAPTKWRGVASLREHTQGEVHMYIPTKRFRCQKHPMRGKLKNRKRGILKC